MPRRQSARSDPDPRWTSNLAPAPGDLRIVQAFVNTADLALGTDLAGPEALARWLAHWSLAPADTELDDADLARAVEVREALRALIRANRPKATVSDAAVARLDRAAHAATLRVRFADGGHTRLEAATNHLDGAVARLCAIVATAQTDGSWKRMKICSGTVCRAAYYDFSRNHSARYCQVQCGNRISALAYKRRNLEHRRKMDAIYSHGRRYARRRSKPKKNPFSFS